MASLARIIGATAGLNPSFASKLNAAADAAGIPVIQVTSGVRSAAHNAAVGGVPRSNHLTGNAVDGYAIYPDGRKVPLGVALQPVVGKFGLRSGNVPGFYHGGVDTVHVDDGANQPGGVTQLPNATAGQYGTVVKTLPNAPAGVPTPLWQAISSAAAAHGVDPNVLVGIWINEDHKFPNPYVNSSGYGGLFGTSNWNASTQAQADSAASTLSRLISEKGSLSAALLAYSGKGYSSVPGVSSSSSGLSDTTTTTAPGSSVLPGTVIGAPANLTVPGTSVPGSAVVVNAAVPHAPLYPGAPAAVTQSAFPSRTLATATKPAPTTAAPFDWTAWASKVAAGGALTPADQAALAKIASTRAASETAATIAGIRAQQDAANQQASLRAAQQEQLGLASSQFLQGLNLGGQSATDYANAAAAQRAAAAGYSGGLQQTVNDAAAAVQQNLQALGSPQTADNQAAAAGNALYGLGGNLPAERLDAIGPTVAAGLRALPAQTLGYGQQLAAGELGAGQQEAAKLTPDIITAKANQATLAAKYLDTLSTQAQQAGQNRIANLFKVAAIAQTQQAAGLKAGQVNVGESKLRGYLVNNDGTVPTDAKGNVIPVSAAAGKPFRYQDSYGREIQLNADGTQSVMSAGTLKVGSSVYEVGIDGKVSAQPIATGVTALHTRVVSDAKGQRLINADTGATIAKVGGVSASSSGAPTGPPYFDSTSTNTNHYRSDQYGNAILVNGKIVPQAGYKVNAAGTGVVKATGAAAGKTYKVPGGADTLANTMRGKVQVNQFTGQPIPGTGGGPVAWPEAIARMSAYLRAHGAPAAQIKALATQVLLAHGWKQPGPPPFQYPSSSGAPPGGAPPSGYAPPN